MPAKKTATGTSKAGGSRVTTALRKATGVVAKTARRTAGTKAATSKAAAKKTPAKKSAPVKKAATKKAAPAKKSTAKNSATKAAAKKTAAKKAATAKKSTVTKTAAAKVPAKKQPAGKKTTGRKPATKKTTAKKTTAKKAAPVKKTAAARTTTKPPVKKAVTKKTAAPQTPAQKVTARKLRVRDDESPWTAKELAGVRAELEGDVQRLTHELSGFEDDIAGLIKDSGDGAGDDQADTGAKTFEREHEASLAQNSRDLLEQSVHALQRIDDGTYGVCENCGNAIGKLRLQAFPRATLCLSCKAKQERR